MAMIKCPDCGKERSNSGLDKFRHCECTQSDYLNVSVVMLPYVKAERERAFRQAYMANPYAMENWLKDNEK